MTEWLGYGALGAFAGLLAGLLGVGGGLVIVPVLALIFHQAGMTPSVIMHMAIGTSLATIVFTSLSSVWAHHRHGAVMWTAFRDLTPGIVFGAMLGAMVADSLPSDSLKTFFGLFELMVALQMGLNILPSPKFGLPGAVGMGVAGGVIGMVSAIVGIGGGTMTVPFLQWCHVSMRQAVATSAACGLPIALTGAVGFLITGWGEAAIPEAGTGYIYWPAFLGIVAASIVFAPLGARLAHWLPAPLLKRFFSLFLALLAMGMLWPS